VLRGDEVVKTARGWTVDISNSGVLLEADDALPEGIQIELSLAWPARLNNDVGLELCASGSVVRRDKNRTAVRIERHVSWQRLHRRTEGTSVNRRVVRERRQENPPWTAHAVASAPVEAQLRAHRAAGMIDVYHRQVEVAIEEAQQIRRRIALQPQSFGLAR
jgi:hypothetical protein